MAKRFKFKMKQANGTFVEYMLDVRLDDVLSADKSQTLAQILEKCSKVDHTHKYAGSSSVGGAANSAVKLSTARDITIGNKTNSFDGSGNINFSLSDIGAAAASHGTHVEWAANAPLPNGTAHTGKVNKVAREDHVHPLQTTVSGNAGTATKLETARDIKIGNKTNSFDGSTNIEFTLSDIGAAAASHGTHVNYSSTAPAANGTASAGTANNVARGDHVHPLQTTVSGNAGTATKLANAKNITIGNKTNSFDGSDNITFTLSDIGAAAASHGTHVTWATNAAKANGTAAIGTVDRVAREDHVHPLQTSVSGNAGSATKLATARNIKIGNKTNSFDGTGDITFTLSDIGAAAVSHGTHVDWATNVPLANGTTAIGTANRVAREDHVHPLQTSVSGNAGSANKVNNSMVIKLNGGATEGTNLFTFNGSAGKTVNITASLIGAANSSHDHNDKYYTETEIDTKLSNINTAISTAQTNAVNTSKEYTNAELAKLVDSAPDALNTLNELASAITTNKNIYDTYVGEVSAALAGKAPTNHGNHVPTTETANNARFLRNDNTWQTITPANIGAAAASHGTHLTLGTTSANAFRGDYGNTAYAHSQEAHAPSNAQKNSDITKAEIEAKLTGSISSHNHDGQYYTEAEINSKLEEKANSSHGTHVTWATTAPKANGTAAVGTVDRVAREDHVHPLQTTVSGNAGSATKLATARTIKIGNKSNTFNGTSDITFTLSDIGAAAASHGTHVTYSETAPLANGTAAVGTANNVARGDHVHPLQTDVSGNAGSANKLTTGRNITIGNKTNKFDGTENISFSLSDIGAMPLPNCVLKTITDGTINLSDDRYQYVTSMPDGTTITLPTVTEFTEVHLFFYAESDLTLVVPNILYQKIPNIASGCLYEFIYTYILGRWVGGFIEYGKNKE